MTSFDYRIMRRVYRKPASDEILDTQYYIVEATYDENGKVFMASQEPEGPYGGTVSDLMLAWMELIEAFNKPILDYDNIPEEGAVNVIQEQMDELTDEDGNMRPTEELEAEGKIHSYKSVAEMMSAISGDSIEECEKRQREFREEEAKRVLDNETSYAINNIGQPLPEVLGNIIEQWVKNLEDDDLEYN